eukprot:CAMPEP_0180573230 /NCGR_PEP_ID=MMETSP1037_2-20121125/9658_1 /TAXON_ID=632150 /ORGANISM="Azadinium spinosum, Strain 3D9" /LENGTH=43 /DNA_ID= /DNA_START= /DNA_END= /DNA_ORIENTATION=
MTLGPHAVRCHPEASALKLQQPLQAQATKHGNEIGAAAMGTFT